MLSPNILLNWIAPVYSGGEVSVLGALSVVDRVAMMD